MILPDHPTPIRIRTHSIDPVPFMIYSSEKKFDGVNSFTENTAKEKNNYHKNGFELMNELIKL